MKKKTDLSKKKRVVVKVGSNSLVHKRTGKTDFIKLERLAMELSSLSNRGIDVVLVSSNSRALTCLASTTGGHFYSIDNLSDFTTTMTKSIQAEPQTPAKNNRQKYEYINE